MNTPCQDSNYLFGECVIDVSYCLWNIIFFFSGIQPKQRGNWMTNLFIGTPVMHFETKGREVALTASQILDKGMKAYHVQAYWTGKIWKWHCHRNDNCSINGQRLGLSLMSSADGVPFSKRSSVIPPTMTSLYEDYRSPIWQYLWTVCSVRWTCIRSSKPTCLLHISIDHFNVSTAEVSHSQTTLCICE